MRRTINSVKELSMEDDEVARQICEQYKKRHIKEWNPIRIDIPFFGPNDKYRQIVEALVQACGSFGFNVAHVLILKSDEELARKALELLREIDAFNERECASFQEQKGDSYNRMLEDLIFGDEEPPS